LAWWRRLWSVAGAVALVVALTAITNVVGPATASAAMRPRARIVYATKHLGPRSFGEIIVAVPARRGCQLSFYLRDHLERRSAIVGSPTGQTDFTWTVPSVITAGTRRAVVHCAGGATAVTWIAVHANGRGRERPLATRINADPIRATDPPAVAGKGGGAYPPYGSVILPGSAWFFGHGVNVYSDGTNGGGGYYQCVELANRFLMSEHFGPAIWGNANQLYADAPPAYYQTHPNGSGYIPVPGDLVVFGGETFGHVAVVNSVSSTSVDLVEQNASPTGRATISLTGSRLGGIYSLYVIGVIHARANQATNPSNSPPPSTPPPTSAPAPTTYTETTGGATNTWSDYADAGGTSGSTVAAHASISVGCRITGFAVADGNTWWYKIVSSPWNGNYYASADAFYNNGQTTGSLQGTPFYDPQVPLCSTGGGTVPPNPPPVVTTWSETTGGVTHTWTDYSNGGGVEGPSLATNQTVSVACRVSGLAVADGNTWWYKIVSSPWNGNYYASADAFYNNGQTTGSLQGTPFYDPQVPVC